MWNTVCHLWVTSCKTYLLQHMHLSVGCGYCWVSAGNGAGPTQQVSQTAAKVGHMFGEETYHLPSSSVPADGSAVMTLSRFRRLRCVETVQGLHQLLTPVLVFVMKLITADGNGRKALPCFIKTSLEQRLHKHYKFMSNRCCYEHLMKGSPCWWLIMQINSKRMNK